MKVGKPLKFESVEELQTMIDAYFEECDAEGTPYTISGLACALDTTRRTLLDYEDKEKYAHTIKRAKSKIEAFNERMLYSKDVPTTGVIFNLKNNYGWKDTQEIEAKVDSSVNINIELSDE